ncbi:pyridoxamine 5'-phosphate oxidase family protein [Azorhizobium doebereinerae]|uniref:pyridoxamine 5'-phosphate oxidase family protein n=1 Tax=Azorhizobium doebereinerae TaxID=281091 RepID=UPI0003FB0E18|nr:pyridoxamine 5'-phosphate oxidase family protein [Azorhizobium doebereinerae]
MTHPTTAEAAFPVTPRNKVKRMHERGSYDRAVIYPILDAGFLCHVSYVIDGQPFATPTIHWREGDTLYWHGSSASRMLRHLKDGASACLTVSHLDGLVLARCGFNHSANYRSAMCFGTARIVDEPAAKAAALSALVDRFFPGRDATLRPMSAQEIKATTVIAMPIDEASAKVRAKGVGDDAEDMDLPIWAGVIPVRTVIGAIETSPHVPAGVATPDSLGVYAQGATLDSALLATQRLYEGE